jgi:hypothetical protein
MSLRPRAKILLYPMIKMSRIVPILIDVHTAAPIISKSGVVLIVTTGHHTTPGVVEIVI